jgi:hypothetical protein
MKLYFSGRRPKIVPQEDLDALTIGDAYKLHDGELVKASDSSVVYVVEGGALRPIPSEDVFESVGWNWKNIVTVPAKVIAIHPVGDPVSQIGSQLAVNDTN